MACLLNGIFSTPSFPTFGCPEIEETSESETSFYDKIHELPFFADFF